MHKTMIEKVIKTYQEGEKESYGNYETIIATVYSPFSLYGYRPMSAEEEFKLRDKMSQQLAKEVGRQLSDIGHEILVQYDKTTVTAEDLFTIADSVNTLVDNCESLIEDIGEVVIDVRPETAVSSLMYMETSGESDILPNSKDYYIIVVQWKIDFIEACQSNGINLFNFVYGSLAGTMS